MAYDNQRNNYINNLLDYTKITILGAGAFGVALAKLASHHAKEVALWARSASACTLINNTHKHPTKLSDVVLAPHVKATNSLAKALDKSSVVIIAVPMDALSEVLSAAALYISPQAVLISTAKGIKASSLKLSCDIINDILSADIAHRACYLSGPSFASELAQGLPTALTIASKNSLYALDIQKKFSYNHVRLYYSDDVIGICVGGALKNVIAIAAGACFGLNLGRNALASLITRGLAEITRLAIHMGAKSKTLRGLSGMGDLVLSCTDTMSRNYQLGVLLAQGMNLDNACSHIGSVVEGSKSALAIKDLIYKYNIEMPISLSVYNVLYNNLCPQKALESLFERELKNE